MRVLQISDERALGQGELLRRLDRLAALPRAARRHFAVQLRDPELSTAALLRLGRALRARTRELGAKLHVNDRIDVALVLQADGVHLGRRSIRPAEARALLGPGAWVSRSAHGLDELEDVDGVDAVVLSPIFASPGKGAPLGVGALAEARRALPTGVCLVALGGVDEARAGACFEAGADAVASIRADLVGVLAPGWGARRTNAR